LVIDTSTVWDIQEVLGCIHIDSRETQEMLGRMHLDSLGTQEVLR
jgi:hypothetical protein